MIEKIKECVCGKKFTRPVKVPPLNCVCGRIYQADEIEWDRRGYDKELICQGCREYDSDVDACKILTAKGKAGKVAWLRSHPDAKCVHPTEPFF